MFKNKEFKAKVVEALRSGKYKQRRGYMNRDNCFCVWGVICDVSGLHTWQLRSSTDGVAGVMEYGGHSFGAPEDVAELVGFKPETEALEIDGVESTLMGHNDEEDATFEQLATAIEEQL